MIKMTGLVVASMLAVAGLMASGCGSTAPPVPAVSRAAAATPVVRPAVTVVRTVTASPSPRRHHHQSRPVAQPAALPVPAPVNSEAVVDQFYQDITNHDYAAAWALGGDNIGGMPYAQWVAGYATTASISLGTDATWNGPTVNAELVALQDDGTVRTYQGTYTVTSGVITAANIVQAS